MQNVQCVVGTLEIVERAGLGHEQTGIVGMLRQGATRQFLGPIGMIGPQLDIDQGRQCIAMIRILLENGLQLMPRLVIPPFPGQHDPVKGPRIGVGRRLPEVIFEKRESFGPLLIESELARALQSIFLAQGGRRKRSPKQHHDRKHTPSVLEFHASGESAETP